ncbi:MAG: magnesium transporter, partial [Bradyrhizobium sp.]|nr:magnesium transporter [Bradyrhizobium sp.]
MAEAENRIPPETELPPAVEVLEDDRLTGDFVDEVRDALAAGDAARVRELVDPLH